MERLFYARYGGGGTDNLPLSDVLRLARANELERLGPFDLGALEHVNARPWRELDDRDLYDRFKKNVLAGKYYGGVLPDGLMKEKVVFWTIQKYNFTKRYPTAHDLELAIQTHHRLLNYLPQDTAEYKAISQVAGPAPQSSQTEWYRHFSEAFDSADRVSYDHQLSFCRDAIDIVHTADLINMLARATNTMH